MLRQERKACACDRLRTACGEIKDALNLSVQAARDDLVVIPKALRNELSVMLDDLERIVFQLEATQ
jgi:hypothetical protein